MKNIIIGYSGHAYVVCEIFESIGEEVIAYCDIKEKQNNPYDLEYLGTEKGELVIQQLKKNNWFVAIGDNDLRKNVVNDLMSQGLTPISICHSQSIVPKSVVIGDGVMCAAGVIINAQVKLGNGVICNTGSIIEHECVIGDFAHIAPGAILAGNVHVGEGSFVGANAVIKQGVKIGKNAIIGTGSVILEDVLDGTTVAGNPGREISKK